MSRELKELIGSLEQRRDELHTFAEALRAEVHSGALTQDLADEIFRHEYGNESVLHKLATINTEIAEAHDILRAQRKELAVAVSPGVLVIAVGLVMLFSYSGFTGLFTFSDETFYQYDIGATFSAAGTIPLPQTHAWSSARIDGEANGVGTAAVYLDANGTRYLIARFDSSEAEASGLTGLVTGLFTDDTTTVDVATEGDATVAPRPVDAADAIVPVESPFDGAVPDIGVLQGSAAQGNETNRSRNTNETNETNTTVSPTEIDVPILVNTTKETNATSETETLPETVADESESTPTGTQETEAPETEAPETETPAVDEPEPQILTPQSTEFDNECLQTCVLPPAQPAFTLIIEVNGSVNLTIDSLTYGLLPEEALELPLPGTNGTNSSALNTTNETMPTGDQGILGLACSADADCASGTCTTSMFEGALQPGVCADSPLACMAAGLSYEPGQQRGSSVCVASDTAAVWIARSGQGRFDVRNANNTTVGVIDKFGTMVVSGPATFSTTVASEGWIVKDAQGVPQIAISSEGAMTAAGMLITRTAPQPTEGGDFIIKDPAGVPQAVFTETGNVTLHSDFLSEVRLQ